MAQLRANTELVAAAWLRGVPGVPSTGVGTTLPADNSTWAPSGFVQVNSVGGSSNLYVPLREPVVGVICWAVAPDGASPKAPWGKANNLAEDIIADTHNGTFGGRLVTLPGDFPAARVKTAWVVNEPARLPNDDASYAAYTLDLALSWVEVPS